MSATDRLYGVMAEFESSGALVHGVEHLRGVGFTRIEAYSPFPVHGLEVAMNLPGSKVPWIVLGGAILGGSGALLMQWWMSAVDYPVMIAGKPYFSLPAFVPITFELSILFSAFAAVLGMLALNGLPRPFHPVFTHPRFKRATDDGFFLAIEAADPRFDLNTARQALSEAGGTHVEVLEA